MKYDFVLFENLFSVENHYKDLGILVTLLKEAGYKVAIADAFKEDSLCKIEGVPHLRMNISCPSLFKEPNTYSEKLSGWKSLYYRIKKDIYLYRIVKYLNTMAPNIYLGSMTLATPAFFFKAFSSNNKYYMWALRSAHVMNWKSDGFSFYSLISKLLYRNIHKYKNLRLVVSNTLIKKEFINDVGIEEKRIIQRPERYIDERRMVKGLGQKGKSLHLLFIGTLRPFKNVEFCINALKELNNPNIKYIIAGRCKNDNQYNDRIARLSADLPNVIRIDRFISDEEYERLMNECDFLVLCDKKQKSCASNGTMTEALLHGKPIIAPDINPFRYECEKNGVGYLYKYGDVESLKSTLSVAFDNGTDVFDEGIMNSQDNYVLANVVNQLKEQLNRM